jgi:hypothetical protein
MRVGGEGKKRSTIDEIKRALWEGSEPLPHSRADQVPEKTRDIFIHGDGNIIVMNVMIPKEV